MFAGTLAPYSFKGITGKDHDPKSGLMFYNSRWYDPHVGRFTHKRIGYNRKQKYKGPDWTPKNKLRDRPRYSPVLSQKEEAVEKAAGEEAGEDKENAPENGNRQ